MIQWDTCILWNTFKVLLSRGRVTTMSAMSQQLGDHFHRLVPKVWPH